MLEYFRMVGKGGKEKEEKTLDSEPGDKPIDTASLIAALHPFGQGGVKFARSSCGQCFPPLLFLHRVDPLHCTSV